jgi:hypothetical protein
MFSVNENCDVECYRLFEEMHLFSAVVPLHIFNTSHMFKFIILRNLSEMYPSTFISLGMTMTSCYYCTSSGALFKAETDKSLTSEQLQGNVYQNWLVFHWQMSLQHGLLRNLL